MNKCDISFWEKSVKKFLFFFYKVVCNCIWRAPIYKHIDIINILYNHGRLSENGFNVIIKIKFFTFCHFLTFWLSSPSSTSEVRNEGVLLGYIHSLIIYIYIKEKILSFRDKPQTGTYFWVYHKYIYDYMKYILMFEYNININWKK